MNTPVNYAVKALVVLLSMQAIQTNAQAVQPSAAAPADPGASAASNTSSDKDSSKVKSKDAEPAPSGAPVQTVDVHGFASSIGFSTSRANVTITKEELGDYAPGVSGDKVLERVSGIQQGSSNALGGSTFDATINMRGFEKDSIGFSIDGIPNGRTTLGGGAVPSRFFDSSNLASVHVSQSAGDIGAPTNQALAGQIDYVTADPTDKFGAAGELSAGSAHTRRAYVLINSGEVAGGFKGYVSASRSESQVSYVPNPSGMNTLDHLDLKVERDFDNGAVVKLKYSYNDVDETSAANVVTLQSFKANPKTDGFTDSWTGNPLQDVNYRSFYGNPRKDQMTYLSISAPVLEHELIDVKVYNARQDGVGKFAALGNSLTALDGSANSLYFRANDYNINRNGVLAELSGSQSQYLSWRAGTWIEGYNSGQHREFYLLTDPTIGDAYASTSSLTSSRLHWHDHTGMFYVANTSTFGDGKFRADYGLTYLKSSVDFDAPILSDTASVLSKDKFNYQGRARANSGILPKIGLLYRIDEADQIFAGYSKNAASIGDPTVQANSTPDSAPLSSSNKMDTANAFDLGVRRKGDSYSVGLQGFVINAKQTFASDIPSNLTVQNVPEGRDVKGIELNYTQVVGGWTFYNAATVQQCKYRLENVDANGYPLSGFIRNDSACIGIASKNLFSEVAYQATPRFKVAANLRLKSGWTGYYANPNVAGSGSDDHIASSALLGLNMAYKFDRQQVGLDLQNITDRHYISGVAPELESSASSAGRYFIGAPRSVYVWYRLEL